MNYERTVHQPGMHGLKFKTEWPKGKSSGINETVERESTGKLKRLLNQFLSKGKRSWLSYDHDYHALFMILICFGCENKSVTNSFCVNNNNNNPYSRYIQVQKKGKKKKET